ncbi:hypothetical protein Q4603_19740 [Zobellia galactanivorans]|uniref:Kelch repeat-containing protein n=1 Tax=Zobellia TaxID=112040 RepID=UPI000B533E69|nr:MULTISPECIES: hypothetical protein [Zobellia]MDO6810863.1 hypothetical protein [Zobellia galactanivorans]OWW26113.1 hypothetical protein B4Q04_00060 [Zobellia sp. OII3]
MKIIKYITVCTLFLSFLSSCDKDLVGEAKDLEEGPTKGLPEDDSLRLEITTVTHEDQMGSFYDNGIVEFQGKIWSVAGYNSYSLPNCNSDIWSSDNGINWRSVTSNHFGARRGHATAVFKDKIWVISGINTDASPWVEYDDIWSSTDGEAWTQELEHAPFGHMFYPSLTVFHDKMFIIGTSSSDEMVVWSTADGISWNLEASSPFPKRESHQTVVFNDKMYVIGGQTAGHAYNDIWSSDDGATWTNLTLSGDVFSGRFGHGVTVYDNKVWVLGGTGILTGPYADLYYSEDMEEWTQYTDLGPSPTPLSNFGTLTYNGAIWIFGGYDNREPIGEIVTLKAI